MTLFEELKTGDRFLDTYRIEDVLGRGRTGSVYLATDEKKNRKVALKMLHAKYVSIAEFPERFRRDMKALSKISHPNIAQIYASGETLTRGLYVAMEYVEGMSLRRLIDSARRLDLVSSLHYGVQIAEAVGIAHAKGVRHRDIKPENIMVGAGGRLWVVDFGTPRFRAKSGHMIQKKDLGTARYVSPEQIEGARPDARADLYAIGIVLYEMLAGRHPYPVVDEDDTIDDATVLAAHVAVEAVPLAEVVPDFPDAVWDIVAKCLVKDRERRYATAEALAKDLRAALRLGAQPGHPIADWIQLERARRRG